MSTHQKESDTTVTKHYTPKELANLLGISCQLLSSLRKTGRGPKYIKFGYRNILYSAAEVDTYLKKKERLSTSDLGSHDPNL